MKILILVFLLIMIHSVFSQTPPVEPGVSNTLAKWRAAHYSDVRYRLNITLEKGAPLMKGDIEIRVNLSEEGKRNDLILDWRTTAFANDKDKPYARVLKINNAIFGSVPYEEKEHLIIPKGALRKGENVISIEFASPIKTSGAAITRYVDKEDGAEYVYSLFVPSDASTAFPVFDQPDLKARFSLTTKTSESWKVVSNANLKKLQTLPTSHSEDWKKKLKITDFEETKPISTYVFAFAAGDFVKMSEPSAVADGLTQTQKNLNIVINNDYITPNLPNAKLQPPTTAGGSDIYVRKSQAEKFKQHADEVFRLNREGVKFLAQYFDYKFPFPKYDLVLIPEFPFGGMEHAGATFLRESSVIFPTEPTKNDYVSRANLIFHEAAHQWFGDVVTMRWFDDLWLKEGFATFIGFKTLEKVMPEYNAWKIFYERNKQSAYLTDATRGTTPIYQEIPNLSAAKSAYGSIVYSKAPSFLKQAEFYLGADKFQTAVRAFLKKHQFANAEWTDLVKEFETAGGNNYVRYFASSWVTQRGMPTFTYGHRSGGRYSGSDNATFLEQTNSLGEEARWLTVFNVLTLTKDEKNGEYIKNVITIGTDPNRVKRGLVIWNDDDRRKGIKDPDIVFPNYQDHGYGIFLLDEKSRDYVLQNIQNEKDDFLRTMMWGSLWDSVREAELAPKDYVELVIKNINVESDESTIQTLLGRVSTAMNYYIDKSEPPAVAGGLTRQTRNLKNSDAKNPNAANDKLQPPATAGGSDLSELTLKIEDVLTQKMQNAPTLGQRITFYRAFLNIAASEDAREILKESLNYKFQIEQFKLKTKDKFDIVTKLLILGDKDAPQLLAELEKAETSDEAKRYAYAAKAGIAAAENKVKFWNDFVNNKEISENWVESAFVVFNSPRHANLTLPYLEKSLAELPNLKRNRKIFFVNGWLAAFIGGQRSAEALQIVNKFLEKNPNLDKDLRLKILENADGLERAVKIRAKFAN